MENRLIKDAQITASSEYHYTLAAVNARLNFKAGGGKHGAWTPASTDASPWIQVALGSFTNVTGVATQGRNAAYQWVTRYQLQYSDDGVNFRYYKAICESFPKVKLYPADNFKLVHSFMAFLQSSKNLNRFVANLIRLFFTAENFHCTFVDTNV